MTKPEFINRIATANNMTKKDATIAIDAVIDGIKSALSEGEKIQLIGFGPFEVSERAAREARNPKTGEKLMVAACKTPKFKASSVLKKAVNA